jgi:hypothetical protein
LSLTQGRQTAVFDFSISSDGKKLLLNSNLYGSRTLTKNTAAPAQQQQSDPESDFTVSPIGSGVEITRYVGSKQEVSIPAKIQGKSVTRIADFIFDDLNGGSFAGKNLISVTIPNSVTYIGELAFYGNQLISVSIPNSVTSIGANAFGSNPSLTAINVSSDNRNYSSVDGVLYNKNGSSLLLWPTGKKPVTIPNSVTSIGANAFESNQLTSVTLPSSVTTIGASAFVWNQMTSVTIGSNVTIEGVEIEVDAELADFLAAFGLISMSTNNSFEGAYNNSGRAAGTYTRPSTNETWMRR